MKILTVVGARPQFVKAAAVSRAIAKHSDIKEMIVHTGQHYDENMSEIFFREMEIPEPAINLGIKGKTHGAMTGQMLEGLEKVMMQEKPDVVLIFGDTNSTLAGALAARKLHLKLAHVEAGLRSYNILMPEEVNRIVADRLSDLLFCTSEIPLNNLKKEGFENFGCKMFNVGDVMYDAALFYSQKSAAHSSIIKKLGLKDFVLCTLHRAENTDHKDRLVSLANALNKINRQVPVVLPLHPRTKKILAEEKIKLDVTIIDPVGYFDMLEMLKACRMVVTDSGGLQKEAFYFKKFCITLRDETEYPELVAAGYNKVTGSDENLIEQSFENFLKLKKDFSEKFFGDGDASDKIVKELKVS
jgi:UDP-GlcNAc3NAcA epimerase